MSVNIVVPEVGESIVDARVARWLKKQGDRVATGDPLVELETDKIDLEVAAPHAGVLGRIDHQDGADVKVGDVLGVIDEGEGAAAGDTGADAEGAGDRAEDSAADAKDAGTGAGRAGEAAEGSGAGPRGAAKTRATPAARKAAQQNAIDLTSVKGSGDAGRVMRRDVEASVAPPADRSGAPAARQAKGAPAPAIPRRAPGERTEERIRMSKRRATIARRLVEVQSTAAMLTTFNEVDMSAVQALRGRH